MDVLLLCPVSAGAMEVVNVQMQRSIAKLPQGVADTGAIDLLPILLRLFYSVIHTGYFVFILHSLLSFSQ